MPQTEIQTEFRSPRSEFGPDKPAYRAKVVKKMVFTDCEGTVWKTMNVGQIIKIWAYNLKTMYAVTDEGVSVWLDEIAILPPEEPPFINNFQI